MENYVDGTTPISFLEPVEVKLEPAYDEYLEKTTSPKKTRETKVFLTAILNIFLESESWQSLKKASFVCVKRNFGTIFFHMYLICLVLFNAIFFKQNSDLVIYTYHTTNTSFFVRIFTFAILLILG